MAQGLVGAGAAAAGLQLGKFIQQKHADESANQMWVNPYEQSWNNAMTRSDVLSPVGTSIRTMGSVPGAISYSSANLGLNK